MPNPKYKRLTRSSARGIFAVAAVSRSSIWLAEDHLLVVDYNGYTESYKRFYFRDIQAFIVLHTPVFTITYIILSIFFLIFTVCGVAVDSSDYGLKIFLFFVAGLLALIGIIHVMRGQTCRCFLRSAVQEERLPSLKRVRRAEGMIAQLRPLLAAAQGGEWVREVLAQMSESAPTPEAAVASPATAVPENSSPSLTGEP